MRKNAKNVMRNKAGMVWIGGAAVLGLIAAGVINASVHGAEKMTTVYVAAQTIPDDTIITANEISIAHTSSAMVPTGAIADPSKVVGKYADATIAKGEPILQSVVAPASTVRQLVRVYGMNYVGATVQLESSDLPVADVVPGDLIDLAGVYGTQNQQVYTQWIAQGLPVLAVDTTNDRLVFAIPQVDALTLTRDIEVGKVRVFLDPQPFRAVTFNTNTSSTNTVPAVTHANTGATAKATKATKPAKAGHKA